MFYYSLFPWQWHSAEQQLAFWYLQPSPCRFSQQTLPLPLKLPGACATWRHLSAASPAGAAGAACALKWRHPKLCRGLKLSQVDVALGCQEHAMGMSTHPGVIAINDLCEKLRMPLGLTFKRSTLTTLIWDHSNFSPGRPQRIADKSLRHSAIQW